MKYYVYSAKIGEEYEWTMVFFVFWTKPRGFLSKHPVLEYEKQICENGKGGKWRKW